MFMNRIEPRMQHRARLETVMKNLLKVKSAELTHERGLINEGKSLYSYSNSIADFIVEELLKDYAVIRRAKPQRKL